MDCQACGAEMLAFPVESAMREQLPGDEPGAAICPNCLSLTPVAEPPDAVPDFTAISSGFPSNPEAAVPMALVVGLLESLATHRQEIGTLLERVERGGVDPLMTLDRLDEDPDVESSVDLAGRRRQLEQLL